MAYADTYITEAQAPDVDGHEFDEVRLAGSTGKLGAKIWFRARAIENAGAALRMKSPPPTRLVVRVDDDPESMGAIERVRTLLRWNGPMSDCPF